MADLNVKLGKQGNEAAADKSKIVKGQKPQQSGGAEGQYAYIEVVSCWNCWALNEIVADTRYYVWFYCWNCGAYCEY